MGFTSNLKSTTALFTVLVLLLGCNLSKLRPGGSSSAGNDSPSRSGTAFRPSSDARKDLGDALRKLKTAYPYRLTEITSATANGKTAMPDTKRVVEFAAPDRSHMKWTGGMGSDMEEITIGEKRYWYADGKWSESAGRSAEEKARTGAELEKKLAEATKEVNYVGAETVNGVPCFAYTYSLEMNVEGHAYTGTGKAWVGAADGLPHQIDADFKVSVYGHKSHIVYEYNVDIKVEKPIL